MWGGLSETFLKSCVSFEWGLDDCNEKNIKATDGRVSIEIRGEMLHDGEFCENPVGWSSMCESPIETAE